MSPLEFHPLTPSRWPDLEALFGEHGASGGCWCMWWRQTRAEFERGKGAANREAFRRLVGSGEPPGILAYSDGRPVGWCAVAPRERYIRLERSRVLQPVDTQPVWSVVCFFIARKWRRKGVARRLLEAALEYARSQGAKILEGYPVEARKGALPDVFAYTGLVPMFRQLGFVEAARRSPNRPIMRRRMG